MLLAHNPRPRPMNERTRRPPLALLFLALTACGVVPVLRGKPTDLAAYRRAGATLAAGKDPWAARDEPRYLYPPAIAALFAVARPLPETPLAVAWTLLSAAAMTFAASRLCATGVLLALLFAPLYATQWNAQVNGFVLLALVLARERLAMTDEDGGGAWWGVSLAVKPLALPAAAGLLLTRRVRALGWGAAVAGLSLLLVVPFLGADGVALAARRVAEILSTSWPDTWPANISLGGALDRFHRAGAGSTRQLAIMAGLFAATCLVTLLKGRKAGAPATLDAFLAAALLGAGASWLHHAAVLLPAAAALPLLGPVSAALFGVAGAWRLAALLWPAHGAAAASACGTAALALLWLAALRRVWRGER